MSAQPIAGFDWDDGNTQKCQKHGVSLAEIEAVFHRPMMTFPDVSHSEAEDRFIGIGKTGEGRHVFVAFTLRGSNKTVLIRPISARYMHEKEIQHYEKAIAQTHHR